MMVKKKMKKPIKIHKFWSKHPKLYTARFLLTCWRPITKYEHVKFAISVMRFGSINKEEHKKLAEGLLTLIKKIEKIEKHLGLDKSNNKDMYA